MRRLFGDMPAKIAAMAGAENESKQIGLQTPSPADRVSYIDCPGHVIGELRYFWRVPV
jgi:hypothetical protein